MRLYYKLSRDSSIDVLPTTRRIKKDFRFEFFLLPLVGLLRCCIEIIYWNWVLCHVPCAEMNSRKAISDVIQVLKEKLVRLSSTSTVTTRKMRKVGFASTLNWLKMGSSAIMRPLSRSLSPFLLYDPRSIWNSSKVTEHKKKIKWKKWGEEEKEEEEEERNTRMKKWDKSKLLHRSTARRPPPAKTDRQQKQNRFCITHSTGAAFVTS